MEAANAAVPKITPAEAKEMIAKGNTLVVDVRDTAEVEKSGKVTGAVNVSRGMLEFRADPDSPYHDKSFDKSKTRDRLLRIRRPLGLERQGARRISASRTSTTSALSRTGPKAAARSRNNRVRDPLHLLFAEHRDAYSFMKAFSSGVGIEWIEIGEGALFLHFLGRIDKPRHGSTVERRREADALHASGLELSLAEGFALDADQ